MIQRETSYRLLQETQMILYTERVREHCAPFSCGNGQIEQDLNDFFENDADLYREELLGKTYCFITKEKPYRIAGLFTISNDSIKTTYLERSTSNRLNRHINNAKRGRSYPAVLIGRLGVDENFQGEGEYSSNSIFLPAGGYSIVGTIRGLGEHGDYWSSTPAASSYAQSLYFKADSPKVDQSSRIAGCSVRAVLAE